MEFNTSISLSRAIASGNYNKEIRNLYSERTYVRERINFEIDTVIIVNSIATIG